MGFIGATCTEMCVPRARTAPEMRTDNSFATWNANKRDRRRWKRCRPCQSHNTTELWLGLSLTQTDADLDAAAPELAKQLYLGTPLMPRRISGGNTFVDVFALQRGIGSSSDLSVVSEVPTVHAARSGFIYLSASRNGLSQVTIKPRYRLHVGVIKRVIQQYRTRMTK